MTAALDRHPYLNVAPIAGKIGAEISGLDLRLPVSKELGDLLWALMVKHKVLAFRKQDLDHKQHLSLGRSFGPLTRRPPPNGGAAPLGYPEILVVDTKVEDERYGEDFEERYRKRWNDYNAGWHTDLTPAVNPPAASILRAENVTKFGGDTQWTNLEAAFSGLSGPLQALVSTLQADHEFFAGCEMHPHDPTDAYVLDLNRDHPLAARHPVVRVHPESGRKSIFVNPASTSRIVGLSPNQSRVLLTCLFEQITRHEYTMRWRWEAGDVLMWDNRSTAHLSPGDAGISKERRTLYRVTLLGDYPTGPDGFRSTAIAGTPFEPLH